MPITRNRFQNFYERCTRNPQAMKAEMEWIRGPLRSVGDIGRADAPDDLPFVPFDVKTADYSPRKIVEVEPGEWRHPSCEPRRVDWLAVGVWFAVLVFWGVALVAWWVR